jgi:mono/diheme cytochrome c family protein
MKSYFLTLFIGTTVVFAANIENGKNIYKKTCSFCHSTNMNGGMGRDFNLVSYTRTKEQIMQQVSNPEKNAYLLGYTSNAMPNFQLSKDDIEDVAEYIDSLQPFKATDLIKNKENKK